ncbi:hypothetical protein HO133_006841 [Letharia lupina]|uniref:Uncharacterized protein n=1 Tax=Letharia lupina TaxID=560253 RepID=A0A8H6F7F2_9LECA|nr:uncharacterized protein HO133_006841 [Letharia lupina]KAF6217503.1 hypothetical protein HO133_006841 [Letharia lupina]
MPLLQTFLTALTLLPSISLAVAPAQVPPNGKGLGFISNLEDLYPEPTGDWLTSTLCYCHSPIHAKEKWQYEKAHIFQHEYYNYHSNATFIVDHMCLSRAHTEGDQCNRPNVGGDNNDWLMQKRYVCKDFPRTEEEKVRQANSKRSTRRGKRAEPIAQHMVSCVQDCDPGAYAPDVPDPSPHPKFDRVCFGVDTDFYGMDEMELKFNRQHRKMESPGQQGRVQTEFEEVQGYCEDMCQSMFKMPVDMKINDKRAGGGSRQFLYTSLDDMCDHCK